MSKRGTRNFAMNKTPDEIAALAESANIVSGVHLVLRDLIVPGVATAKLDNVAEEYVRDHGAEPAFKGYMMSDDVPPFPSTLCISINDVVVHGFPSERELKEGDIVTVDVGVLKDEFYGDCACTYAVGEISPEKQRLLDVAVESLYRGIEQAVTGKWVLDIARAVQRHVEANGFSVVRDLVGHGIGRELHEDPAVPNFVPNPFARHRHRNQKLSDGMAICIEPMVNAGGYKVVTEDDGWTVRTEDRMLAAHFEHMVVVREGRAEILTSHISEPASVAA